jgi:tetratricopeptide (TPR) repeat protein
LVLSAALYYRGYWDLERAGEEAVQSPPAPELSRKEIRPGPPAPPPQGPESAAPARPRAEAPGGSDLPRRAMESFRAGDYEMAAALFSELSKQDPLAFLGLGLSYYNLGDYGSAAAFLEKSLGQRGVDEFQVRKLLAFSYYRLDDLALSLSNAEAALRLSEDPELSSLVERLRKEKPAQDRFIHEETLHFKVLFDGYRHGSVSTEVLHILEDAYRDIGSQTGYFPEEPVTVILYSERKFHDVTRMPDWSGGAFDGKIRVPVKGIEEVDANVLRKVLYHEYAHALVYSITPRCPAWLNEGLAMHLAGEERERVGQIIPLRTLEGQFPRSQEQSNAAYNVSYSAVAHLIDNYGLYSIVEFLRGLSSGQDVDSAFRSSFFMSYNDFADSWGKG